MALIDTGLMLQGLSRRGPAMRPDGLQIAALLIGGVALLPLAGVLVAAMSGAGAALPSQDLLRYAGTSLWLALLVGLSTAVVGTAAAWLLAMHSFPGSRFFAWALALPFAAPAFALAYAYSDMFDPAGGLRMMLRSQWGVDLPFEMRSLGGAVFVLSCAFYPYVYLTMRASFLVQSSAMLDAARLLGCGSREAFVRVALPLARPALAAGVGLAIMETLADYGAVQFLAVQTLTTGIVRAWSVFGSVAGAAQLALPLLVTAALLLYVERALRSGRSHAGGLVQSPPMSPVVLRGWRAGAAWVGCAALLVAALVLPAAWLLVGALDQVPDTARLARAVSHSLSISVLGAVVTTTFALVLALGAARHPLLPRMVSVGYATPGAAIAIGLLLPATIVWQLLPLGAGFWVAIVLLVYAYTARLAAAALEPISAALTRVTPSMTQAARTMGRSGAATAMTVQVPLVRGGLFSAMLLVFVDIMKELPATLILRPFNFDTLAVMASNYALDERLGQAGWPSLLIILCALGPTIWLSRKVAAAPASHASTR